MSRAICLYLHAHQPYRIREYGLLEAGRDHNYFIGGDPFGLASNEGIIRKVAEKSYRPTNHYLLQLLKRHPEFRVSLSITGTLIEQLEQWAPDVLESFQELVATGRVEILGEAYYHSLAFFYSIDEFEAQVKLHKRRINELFGVTPKVFRNTELAYNNDLAAWADRAGYKGIITEGWDPVLDWRSPNYVYRPTYTSKIRLLLKNYRLSDDIAFRFSDRNWNQWPLTADKFVGWVNALDPDQQLVNLFMDYETFGEHQWEDHGIFNFLEHMAGTYVQYEGNHFVTPSEAIAALKPRDYIDVPETITWADTERDLSAWLGNRMQQQAVQSLYALESEVMATKDIGIIGDWRRLTTSDHLYYMCTKWFTDGDVHAYFSPYESPYDGFMHFMNVLRDLRVRVDQALAAPPPKRRRKEKAGGPAHNS
ncbi:MAG TPA: glycoside hydrolase family 57 protein [Candidatus Saccharimonadales bacterium]|nr:glycoside hydrolase family 57 protein [Candidatus Saccharimonadales bacterium]